MGAIYIYIYMHIRCNCFYVEWRITSPVIFLIVGPVIYAGASSHCDTLLTLYVGNEPKRSFREQEARYRLTLTFANERTGSILRNSALRRKTYNLLSLLSLVFSFSRASRLALLSRHPVSLSDSRRRTEIVSKRGDYFSPIVRDRAG